MKAESLPAIQQLEHCQARCACLLGMGLAVVGMPQSCCSSLARKPWAATPEAEALGDALLLGDGGGSCALWEGEAWGQACPASRHSLSQVAQYNDQGLDFNAGSGHTAKLERPQPIGSPTRCGQALKERGPRQPSVLDASSGTPCIVSLLQELTIALQTQFALYWIACGMHT